MKIEYIPFRSLPENREGIVFLGVGGDLQKWICRLSRQMKSAGATPTAAQTLLFEQAIRPSDSICGRTDLVLVFRRDAPFNLTRLALWRQTSGYPVLWLSDFRFNYRNDYAS